MCIYLILKTSNYLFLMDNNDQITHNKNISRSINVAVDEKENANNTDTVFDSRDVRIPF